MKAIGVKYWMKQALGFFPNTSSGSTTYAATYDKGSAIDLASQVIRISLDGSDHELAAPLDLTDLTAMCENIKEDLFLSFGHTMDSLTATMPTANKLTLTMTNPNVVPDSFTIYEITALEQTANFILQ